MMDDSGEDLFITQSTFRSEVDTQDACEAVDFLSTSFDLLSDDREGHEVRQETVKNASATSSAEPVVTITNSPAKRVQEISPVSIEANVIVGQEPLIPLESNLTEDDVDVVSDEVVSAALDAVMSNVKDPGRFGEPVADMTVQLNTAKG